MQLLTLICLSSIINVIRLDSSLIPAPAAPHQSTFTSSSLLSKALTHHKKTRTIKPEFHPQWVSSPATLAGFILWQSSQATNITALICAALLIHAAAVVRATGAHLVCAASLAALVVLPVIVDGTKKKRHQKA